MLDSTISPCPSTCGHACMLCNKRSSNLYQSSKCNLSRFSFFCFCFDQTWPLDVCAVRERILTQTNFPQQGNWAVCKSFKKHGQTTLMCGSKGLQQTMCSKHVLLAQDVLWKEKSKFLSAHDAQARQWTKDFRDYGWTLAEVLFITKHHESRKSIHPLRKSISRNNLYHIRFGVEYSWLIIRSYLKKTFAIAKIHDDFQPTRILQAAVLYTFANMIV